MCRPARWCWAALHALPCMSASAPPSSSKRLQANIGARPVMIGIRFDCGGAMIPISKPDIGAEEKAAVFEVLDSGMIAMGPRTAQFEQAFAEMCGVKHAIAVASGTTALHSALLAN